MALLLTTRKFHPRSFCRRCLGLSARYSYNLELDNAPDKTTISLGSAEGSSIFNPTRLFVGGFQFGDNSIIGSIALLPGTVLRWNVKAVEDICEKSLSVFDIIHPPIELIVIGTGTRFERLNAEVVKAMRSRGIALEIQDSLNACGTYNLLSKERPGLIGAALLPLTEIKRPTLPNQGKRKRLQGDNI